LGVQIAVVFSYGGDEGSRTPVRNHISIDVYECMPPIRFPVIISDGRKNITGSFISAESPQSLIDSVPCADRRAGGPDLMTLITGGTGDLRVNVTAIKQPAKKCYFLRLILISRFYRGQRESSTRNPCVNSPVETSTPP